MGSRLLYRELILSLKLWCVDAEISSLFERFVVESQAKLAARKNRGSLLRLPRFYFRFRASKFMNRFYWSGGSAPGRGNER